MLIRFLNCLIIAVLLFSFSFLFIEANVLLAFDYVAQSFSLPELSEKKLETREEALQAIRDEQKEFYAKQLFDIGIKNIRGRDFALEGVTILDDIENIANNLQGIEKYDIQPFKDDCASVDMPDAQQEYWEVFGDYLHASEPYCRILPESKIKLCEAVKRLETARNKLLQAAERLFARRDYLDSVMDEINAKSSKALMRITMAEQRLKRSHLKLEELKAYAQKTRATSTSSEAIKKKLQELESEIENIKTDCERTEAERQVNLKERKVLEGYMDTLKAYHIEFMKRYLERKD
ncbi:MAG: hypothetical protein GX221_07510 [Candidatus Riflebacteria bacterium]|nr:hypothetical protein [Candidatus Riflebacteria bacterium]